MAEQYVEQLAAARERIVADRRELADELAKPYERGRYEQWRRIIEVQATIDAIDRAITDERSIKDKGKPVSLAKGVRGRGYRPEETSHWGCEGRFVPRWGIPAS